MFTKLLQYDSINIELKAKYPKGCDAKLKGRNN